MITTTRSGRCRTALTTALLCVLLAGCGGNDTASGHDATPAARGSDGATSSTSPTPTVAPATGHVVHTSFFSAHVPKGWRVDQVIPDFFTGADDPHGGSAVTFGIAKTYNNHFTLGQLAHQSITSSSWEKEHLDIDLHSSLAGEPAYHLSGRLSGGADVDTYGVSYDARHVTVDFELYAPLSQRQKRQVVDSVLASWQWK